MRDRFVRLAQRLTQAAGSPWACLVAALLILLWACSGPLFHFSDTWQLVANTGTTVVTFLMVFLIQSTANRNEQAIQAKLDELIRVTDRASNALIGSEHDAEA